MVGVSLSLLGFLPSTPEDINYDPGVPRILDILSLDPTK